MFRNAARTFARRYSSSTNVGMSDDAIAKEIKMWKYLSFFVLVPIGACFINAHKLEKEVEEQFEHNRPEFVPYEHLRIRKKRFPWGDGNHTLFHNKLYNPLPEGWED